MGRRGPRPGRLPGPGVRGVRLSRLGWLASAGGGWDDRGCVGLVQVLSVPGRRARCEGFGAVAERSGPGFGGLLRQLRVEARLTQEELAEAAGLSPRSVSDLERGIHRTAHKDTAVLLADALGLAGPVRPVFIAAARGRVPAAEVLAVPGETGAGGLHGFVPALTSFVGRAGAVAEVAGLLEQYRLVTLTGPGGVGKTRLALQAAGPALSRFGDGGWLCDLAPIRDPAGVDDAVAAVFSLTARAGQGTREALAELLRGKQLLLVLDNCEHLIEGAAALADNLARSCERLVILTTSREALGIDGERLVPVPPLATPGAGADLDTIR